MGLFAFITALPGILSGNVTDFTGMVQSIQNTLNALLAMIANNELND